LIIEQAARCRAILAKLRNLGSKGQDPFAAVPLTDLLAEVARPHEGRGKAILFYFGPDAGSPPVFTRSVGLLYGLGNLIENATDFARQTVRIEAGWDHDSISVSITDDGPGFAPELIARLGEPYLTSRPRDPHGPRARQPGGLAPGGCHASPPPEPIARLGEPYLTSRPRDPHGPDASQPGGLGLGVFIAKTLLERTGARLAFLNIAPEGHAQVRIVWPRSAIAV